MMAEATVAVEPASQYFCHTCTVLINPVLPDFLCPSCNGGFVELLSPQEEETTSPNTRQPSGQPVTQPRDGHDGGGHPGRLQPGDWGQLLDMLQLTMNVPPEVGLPRQRAPGGGGTPGSDQRPNLHVHMPRTSITFQNVGNQPIALMDLFNSLPGMTAGGSGNFLFPFLNLHGNPQDYVWGEGGLDTIITQQGKLNGHVHLPSYMQTNIKLLNNVEGQGPPPANKEDIDGLKTVKITDDLLKASTECPVCKEDFTVDEEVKQLPCEHIFHPDCVTTWLHMHNTCPVCRRSIGQQDNQSNPTPRFGGI